MQGEEKFLFFYLVTQLVKVVAIFSVRLVGVSLEVTVFSLCFGTVYFQLREALTSVD